MTPLEAVLICEGETDDEDELLQAWQFLIDTGAVWQLQGSYGRTAINLIDQGYCSPAPGEGADDQAGPA